MFLSIAEQYAQLILNSDAFNRENCINALEATQRYIPTVLKEQGHETIYNYDLLRAIEDRLNDIFQ